jgi:hypothetical protein
MAAPSTPNQSSHSVPAFSWLLMPLSGNPRVAPTGSTAAGIRRSLPPCHPKPSEPIIRLRGEGHGGRPRSCARAKQQSGHGYQ